MGYGYGPGWGMMGDWGYGYGAYGWIHMIIGLVILIAIIAGVVWLVRSMAMPTAHHMLAPPRLRGLDVLEERYARGEINRDEYLEKKRDIAG